VRAPSAPTAMTTQMGRAVPAPSPPPVEDKQPPAETKPSEIPAPVTTRTEEPIGAPRVGTPHAGAPVTKTPRVPKTVAMVPSPAPQVPTSHLVVRVMGAWAEIDLDGTKLGEQHVEKDVPSGDHDLAVKARCCETHTEHLKLVAGETITLPEIRLNPLAAKLIVNVPGAKSESVIVMSEGDVVASGVTGQPIRVDMVKSHNDWTYRRTVDIEVPHFAAKTTRIVAAGDDVTVNLEPPAK
jgi:hypothetical protein